MQISSERTSLVLAVSTKFVTPKRRYSWLHVFTPPSNRLVHHADLQRTSVFSSGPQSFIKSSSLTNDATHGCVSSRLPRIACYIMQISRERLSSHRVHKKASVSAVVVCARMVDGHSYSTGEIVSLPILIGAWFPRCSYSSCFLRRSMRFSCRSSATCRKSVVRCCRIGLPTLSFAKRTGRCKLHHKSCFEEPINFVVVSHRRK
jgi:hypothetical protein